MRSLLYKAIIVQSDHYCTMKPLLHNETIIVQWDHYCKMIPLLYNETTIAQWDYYCTMIMIPLFYNETTTVQWNHYCTIRKWGYGYDVDTTFNNISAKSWVSFIGGRNRGTWRINHWCVASHWQTIMLYQVHLPWAGFELATLVVIGTDWTVSYKTNYHMHAITTNETTIVTCTNQISLESVF